MLGNLKEHFSKIQVSTYLVFSAGNSTLNTVVSKESPSYVEASHSMHLHDLNIFSVILLYPQNNFGRTKKLQPMPYIDKRKTQPLLISGKAGEKPRVWDAMPHCLSV